MSICEKEKKKANVSQLAPSILPSCDDSRHHYWGSQAAGTHL